MDRITISVMREKKEIDFLRGQSSFNYVYDQDTLDSLRQRFSLKDSLYLLATKSGKFVAFCSIDRDWWENDFFMVREILVSPAFHRLGIGQKLFSKCIEHARKKKAVGVVTETDFKNYPMQNLCEKLGFQKWDNPQWKKGLTYKMVF